MKAHVRDSALIVGMVLILPLLTFAQEKSAQSVTDGSKFTTDYPKMRAGVFIEGLTWTSISSTTPFKMRTKRAVASFFSDGAVPAAIVADYQGAHATVEVEPGQPVICICHMMSLPGNPIIVRLHEKKTFRELDGGNLPFLGAKIAEAKKNDEIEVDVSQPEAAVWLVRPKNALPAGEYALMLGAQNISIFPFTVVYAGTPAKLSPKLQ